MENYIIEEELYKKWKSVFWTEEKFNERLNSKIIILNREAPIKFLATAEGRQQIYDLLTRIEYGNLA